MTSPATPAPGTGDGATEVDLLLRLARRWRSLGADEEGDPPLSPHQQRALLAVARLSRGVGQRVTAGAAGGPTGTDDATGPSGVRVSALAAHLGIAPRSATEVADALEAAGLLTRAPDPTDRRAVLLSLTERGRHTVAAVRERRRAAADAAVRTLSPADRAELRRLLELLLDA
ncbi:hypothetical protein GCM10009584_15260 [Ornithinimicrobium humiphilum]|uniref:DNA-binding MarR family transcriptional regulator n=1 Tax=Ornithinimicrobium humiphilum TaxID=125288 RepID=A0A543KKL4_9MICO|nr:MarR family transcriptional regulator [Ornithinimicrobium humiphilum]TQM95618.1 DNA-binding MarR family transcriptional regulator [Ornithinimicrobium humiphilum]